MEHLEELLAPCFLISFHRISHLHQCISDPPALSESFASVSCSSWPLQKKRPKQCSWCKTCSESIQKSRLTLTPAFRKALCPSRSTRRAENYQGQNPAILNSQHLPSKHIAVLVLLHQHAKRLSVPLVGSMASAASRAAGNQGWVSCDLERSREEAVKWSTSTLRHARAMTNFSTANFQVEFSERAVLTKQARLPGISSSDAVVIHVFPFCAAARRPLQQHQISLRSSSRLLEFRCTLHAVRRTVSAFQRRLEAIKISHARHSSMRLRCIVSALALAVANFQQLPPRFQESRMREAR